jgi:hypothetical protein
MLQLAVLAALGLTVGLYSFTERPEVYIVSNCVCLCDKENLFSVTAGILQRAKGIANAAIL